MYRSYEYNDEGYTSSSGGEPEEVWLNKENAEKALLVNTRKFVRENSYYFAEYDYYDLVRDILYDRNDGKFYDDPDCYNTSNYISSFSDDEIDYFVSRLSKYSKPVFLQEIKIKE